jgi:hypothetical protein
MPIYRQVPSRLQGARTRQMAIISECRCPEDIFEVTREYLVRRTAALNLGILYFSDTVESANAKLLANGPSKKTTLS